MKNKLLIIFILILFIFLNSCQNEINFTEEYMSYYSDIAQKKIKISLNLPGYNDVNLPEEYLNEGYKILYTANSDCPPCAITLNEIEKYIKETNAEKIKAIAIFSGQKSDYLDYQISKNNYSFPIYYDSENSFIKTNKLENYTKAIFLLNPKNKIVLVGNPFRNKELKKYYDKFLKQ